jgi:hypothetical protein
VDSAPDAIERAAVAFDAGVKAFERADFEVAARQFLRADELVPNTDALHNAFTAALRTKHDALVATIAERVASREESPREIKARAGKALSDVKRRVARLVLSCESARCELAIDGKLAASGANYAPPGPHLVTARFPDGTRAERSIHAVAGGEQTIVLELESHARPAVAVTPSPSSPEARDPVQGATERQADRPRSLSPAVFYVGTGITLALAGATAWSGIDTLNARARLPGTQSDNDAVMARAHRTDALLIGTLAVGAATATVGLVWTDWDQTGSEVALRGALGERGAELLLTATH